MKKIVHFKNQRDSSIELLRIISMIMILFHHFALHGDFIWNASDLTIPHFWYNFILMGGKVGVNIFVLISGYFLISKKESLFNFKRILKFWGQVFFYSIFIYLLFCIFGKVQIDVKTLIKTLFPITFSKWWFASVYFVLYLLHPFLNKFLNALNKRDYQYFLILILFLSSIIPTITGSNFQGNSLTWFITLYAIGGYIKIFSLNNKFNLKHYVVLWILCSFLTYSLSVIFTFLTTKYDGFASYITYFYNQENILILSISISMFMIFTKLKIKYSKYINVIGSCTFGVYLIHEHDLIRTFLWKFLFKNASYQNSLLIIPYSIIVVIVVFLILTFIDLIRQRFVEKPIMKLIDKFYVTLLRPIKKIRNFFVKFIFGDKPKSCT